MLWHFFLVLPLAVLAIQAPETPKPPQPPQPPQFEEVIVKLEKGTPSTVLEKLNQKFGTKTSQKLLLDDTFTLKVPQGQAERLAGLLSRQAQVEYAEPNYVAKALDVPNDQYFSLQWGQTKIQSPQAWDIQKGQPQVQVAILDTGIDQDHPDLLGKVDSWQNFTTSSTNDDLYGHGTHVAGIAAAATANTIGVAGTGRDIHLISVKVLDDSGSGYYSWVANGIKWAADQNIKVINMSLGGSFGSRTLQDAVNYAWNKGAILVAAAGNSGNASRTYPAFYSNVIAVAATDQNDQKPGFSSYGKWVDVAAPGVDIFSTFPNHPYEIGKNLEYDYASGTSMSTPHVSGLAGLLFSQDSTFTNSQVRGFIENSADKIAGTGKYWAKGRINSYKALLQAISSVQTVQEPTPTPTPTPWWCERWPWVCQ